MNESTPRNINVYSALSAGIFGALATLAVFIFTSLPYMLDSSSRYGGGYESAAIMMPAMFLLCFVLFFSLPALIASKHGWRTVVLAIVFQACLVFVGALIFSLIVGAEGATSSGDGLLYRGDY